jgi:hypothetical protein
MTDINDALNGAKVVRKDAIQSIFLIEDQVRKAQAIKDYAKEMGVSKNDVIAEMERLSPKSNGGASNGSTRTIEQPHWAIEPWADKVDGGELINNLVARLGSHVAAPKEVLLTTALWTAFAWAHDAFVHSPMLLATSPEPECGKSTLLGLVSYLVPRGLVIVEVSPAVLFRMIESWQPTLIVDEADDIFRSNPELRSVINSGWTRGAGVPRCNPDTHEPEFFMTFGPKAIGIKGLKVPPPTLSRSIVVEMERKLPDDKVSTFLHQDDDGLKLLRRQLARFAQDNMVSLRRALPVMPDGFNNRLEANWKPLIAIAELCGNGDEARAAAKAQSRRSDEASIRVQLLADVVEIVRKRPDEVVNKVHVKRMHCEDLAAALAAMEDRPWAEWGYRNPKPITKHQIADMLKAFGIRSEQMKIGGTNKNGYALDTLEPRLTRYQNSTALQPLPDKGLRGNCHSTVESEVEFEKTRNPLELKAGRAVERENTPLRGCAHCGGEPDTGNPVTTWPDQPPLHVFCRDDWQKSTEVDYPDLPNFPGRRTQG